MTDDPRQRDRMADYPGRTGVELYLGSAIFLPSLAVLVVDRMWGALLPMALGALFLWKGFTRLRRARR